MFVFFQDGCQVENKPANSCVISEFTEVCRFSSLTLLSNSFHFWSTAGMPQPWQRQRYFFHSYWRTVVTVLTNRLLLQCVTLKKGVKMCHFRAGITIVKLYTREKDLNDLVVVVLVQCLQHVCSLDCTVLFIHVITSVILPVLQRLKPGFSSPPLGIQRGLRPSSWAHFQSFST